MQTSLSTRQRILDRWHQYSVLIAFVLICIIASVLNDNFLSGTNVLNIVRQTSIIGIVALGQTVVILSGGFDLSVGSVLALVGAVGLMTLNASLSPALAVLATIGAALVIGAVNGVIVAKGKIAPFIVTLGMMATARSVVLYRTHGGSISGHGLSYTNIANGQWLGISYPIYLLVACTLLIWVLLRKTRFGRYIYAIGSNEKATLLSAVRVDRVKIGAYMLCSALVGVAAVIESSRLNAISSSSSGLSYELDSIAAVVIGGTRLNGGQGSIWGTFLGVLILGILNNMINLMNVSPYLQGLVKGMIIIIAVLLQRKD
ncbi:MAG: ribose transporter permease [Firmicutes bacterium]|nr:ribose transporter permease [Bacillota bacterium]